jgi:hypothetical protein
MKVIARREESVGYLCKELPRLAKRINKKIRRSQLSADKARAQLRRRYSRLLALVVKSLTTAHDSAQSQIAG